MTDANASGIELLHAAIRERRIVELEATNEQLIVKLGEVKAQAAAMLDVLDVAKRVQEYVYHFSDTQNRDRCSPTCLRCLLETALAQLREKWVKL